MIYIVSNKKGGSGKSFFAGHLLPEHIRRKGKQERVKLFEFDEHSRTSENYLRKSLFVDSEVVYEENMQEKIFGASFDAKKEDVIIDIGAGATLKKIIETAEATFGLDELVFVVPYSDDSSITLDETVKLIEEYIPFPKILIAINRIPFDGFSLENAKKVAIDLFGSEKYNLPASPVLKKVSKYIKAAIPQVHVLTVFSRSENASLVDLKQRYILSQDLDTDGLVAVWKEEGLIAGEQPTREEYIKNMGNLQRQLEASRFLDECSEFYDSLLELENSKIKK